MIWLVSLILLQTAVPDESDGPQEPVPSVVQAWVEWAWEGREFATDGEVRQEPYPYRKLEEETPGIIYFSWNKTFPRSKRVRWVYFPGAKAIRPKIEGDRPSGPVIHLYMIPVTEHLWLLGFDYGLHTASGRFRVTESGVVLVEGWYSGIP